VGAGSGGGLPSAPLAFAGHVTNDAGSPVANAHVALAANPTIAADTGPDGSFILVGDEPTGKVEPPLHPASRPVEHTIVASKSGYLTTYRGVPGAQGGGLTLALSSGVPSTSGTSPQSPPPSITQYLDDRIAVVTMTFDDTHLSQLTVAKPLFDQYGYKASFYLITSDVGPGQDTTWAMWQAAAADGFEIGNHTRNHWLKDCTAANAQWNHDQIFGGYADILAGMGKPPLTFAFPGGGESSCTEAMVIPAGHVDWRRADHVLDTDRVYPEGDTLTAATGVADIDEVIAHTPNWNGALLSWFLFYMHDVTPERAAVLQAMLDHIAANDDKVWCTTYLAATLYEREREQSAVQVHSRGARSVTFTLTNALDSTIFKVPVSVRVPLPSGTTDVHAVAVRSPAAGPVEVRVRGDHLLVDAIPGTAPIYVAW
jgi:oligosaccharide reducing-end xylanase